MRLDPLVLLIPVDGTEHRAIAVQFPEFRKFGEELRLGNFLQDRFAEVAGDLLHLGRDRRVVRGQVRVGAFRIGDAEAVAEGAEVGVDPAHLRVRCVRKVDGHEVSDRAGHLVKEAAGFAKVLVLRHLRGFRHFNGRDRIVVVKTGEDTMEVRGICTAEAEPAAVLGELAEKLEGYFIESGAAEVKVSFSTDPMISNKAGGKTPMYKDIT